MKYKYLSVICGLPLLLFLIFIACEAPNQPTYGPENPDPNPTGLSPATVDTITPTEGYLKDIITINGSGFNSEPDFNLVAFGTKTGIIKSATETQLQVQAPNISGETVNIKVAVKGSEFWSNEQAFTFKDAIESIDEEIAWPNGVDVDDEGNVYIGSAGDEIIYKITPDGEKSEFASVPVSGAIRFGPNKNLYVCEQGEGKIIRISPDGGTIEDVVEIDTPVYFDWDANGVMYICCNDAGFKSFDGSAITHIADIGGGAKSCRVFENNIYLTDIWDSQILKFTITDAGVDSEAEIVYEGDSPAGIEIDSEGKLYFTEAWETSLYTLSQDGEEDILYEGQLMTPMRYLTFYGKSMYIVYPGWGDVGQTIKAYIGVEQAPRYGRN
ncbi:IPT/TIG domain-containing protein [candidate division KSB1 bacterium]|nr:IPT/TIG domain-containing protein [candidate division KSB1 bacterium]